MNEFDEIKALARIDLNLVIVLRALDKCRHVTQAAKSLGVSQSAVSHSLRRLRDIFEDGLYIKTPRGMVPTPKAEKLAAQLPALLGSLSELFLSKEEFHPEKLERTFKIQTTDLIEHLLLPTILNLQEVQAPGLKVSFGNVGFSLPQHLLEDGKIDLAMAGFFGKLPDGFYSQRLFKDSFRCCVRKNHPTVKKAISLKKFCELPHILIAPGGDLSGHVDRILAQTKNKRQVVAGTSDFLSAGWAVAQSDAILTAPSKLIAGFEKHLPIRSLTSPVNIPDITVVQVWHERHHKDSEHRWFREKIFESQSA